MPTPIIRVILSNLTKKPFTNLFPKNPPIPVPEGFRGLPIYHPEKCVGCRMCVTVCPTRTIIYVPEKKKVRLWVARCLSCGLCAEVCPTKAITMSNDWLLATNNKYNERLVLGPKEEEEKQGESNNKQRTLLFIYEVFVW